MFGDVSVLKENLRNEGLDESSLVFPEFLPDKYDKQSGNQCYKYKCDFKLGKFIKTREKIAISENEARELIILDFRNCKYPPQDFRFEILENY